MYSRVVRAVIVAALVHGAVGCGDQRGPQEQLADQRADILRRGNELEESVRRFGLKYPEFSVDFVERVSHDIASIARMGLEITLREQDGSLSSDQVKEARTKVAALQMAAIEMMTLRGLRDQLRLLDEKAAADSRRSR